MSGASTHRSDSSRRPSSHEIPKCSALAYSPTGHLLAVVGGEGGKEIFIFSTMNRHLLARLKGHYAAVQDIAWSADGLYLASAADGAVYTWHMEGFVRCQESTAKGYFNNSVAATPDFKTLVVGDPTQVGRRCDTAVTAAVTHQ